MIKFTPQTTIYMKSTRRHFFRNVSAASAGALVVSPSSSTGKNPEANYSQLNEVLRQPVLKKELFPEPVIIDSVELMRYKNNFLCRVRSKDGAEGISVSNNFQVESLYPIFTNRLQPFFPGKDARELEKLLDEVYVYKSNYKLQSLALWVPLATIEFAILDMLGRITGKSIGCGFHSRRLSMSSQASSGDNPGSSLPVTFT